MQLVVNGQIIAEEDLTAEFMRVSAGLAMDAPEANSISPLQAQRIAARNLVQKTLLLQRAAAGKLRVSDAEVDAERRSRWGSTANTVCGADVRESIREDMLLERMQAEITRHVQRPGRAECEAYYRAHGADFAFAEAVRAAHIVQNINAPADEERVAQTMQVAMERLGAGMKFSAAADAFSDCKGSGGALGWVERGAMIAEFEQVIFGLRAGTYSGIFRTVFGLHIAHVAEHRSAGRTAFEAARPGIAQRLLAEAREACLRQALAKMEQASQIHFLEGADG